MKYLILIVIILGLISCNDSMNKNLCLESVRKTFPHSKIYIDLQSPFKFTVVNSSGVKNVECMNLTDLEISKITCLIKVN